MERYEDIQELLDIVKENIITLEKSYEKAKQDDEQKMVLRPLIKSSLEHLRSVLEYSTQDIWLSYNNQEKKIFFPYGINRDYFNKSLNKNLPGVKNSKPKFHILIASLQPHKCNNNWLIDLCNQTNFNKHNKLSSQTRKNSSKSFTSIGNLAKIDSSSSIQFDNCMYNGMPLGQTEPVIIDGEMSVEEVKSSIGIPIPVSKEFDWVEFRFENSAIDTLGLIKKSNTYISNYISKLKNEFD